MAISSGLFLRTFISAFSTGLTIDLTSDTDLKAALFTNSLTPDFDTDIGYGIDPYDANEVSGAGYTAGGQVLTGTTLTGDSGVVTFDASDVTWANSTLTGVRGVLIYDDTQTNKNGIVLVNLGADYSTSNGSLVIQWSASGIATWDLVS